MYTQPREYNDTELKTIVVSNAEQMAHAFAVRSICFLEERGFSFRQEFDPNDYQATHFVMYCNDEPVGTSRVRWFAGFARIEKMAFRPSYRGLQILKPYTTFVFSHIARKGYSRLIAVADEDYSRIWEKLLGFKKIPGRELRKPGHNTPYYELLKELNVPSDAILESSPPEVIFRSEGAWGRPGIFG
jgi:hypothetical protein